MKYLYLRFPKSNPPFQTLKSSIKPTVLPSSISTASNRSDFGNDASPGKIFIGGLAKETTIGGGLGDAMGLLLGALDSPVNQDTMTGRQLFLDAAKKMGNKSWGSCKTFAIMGLVFSASECVVEKARLPSFS